MEPGAGDVMPQTWCIIGPSDIRLDMISESLARGIFAEEPVNFLAPISPQSSGVPWLGRSLL